MATPLIFLLKVCLCLAAFYLPYLVFFSRTTFFTANRVYLMVGLLLSFCLPAIIIEIPAQSIPLVEAFVEPFQISETSPATDSSTPVGIPIDYLTVLTLLYFLGITLHIFRLIVSIQKIIKLKYDGEPSLLDGFKVVKTNTTEIFTFFSFIFLPRTDLHSQIINHEKAHVVQYHWIDLVVVEVASILLWFNPIMYFYSRSVKLQHEYLADRWITREGGNLEEYAHRLVEHVNPMRTRVLVSRFYFQFIKKRINMLTKERTSPGASAIYLMVIPIIASILFAFASRPVYLSPSQKVGDSTNQNDLKFISPIEPQDAKISSEFGERIHPKFGKKMFHKGIDFTAEEGVLIMSVEEGVVVTSSFDEANGNRIVIKHDDVYSTSYSHLKDRIVQPGDKVQKGQAIGSVGNTGLSVRSHLHYEVLKNGEAVNPASYMPQPK